MCVRRHVDPATAMTFFLPPNKKNFFVLVFGVPHILDFSGTQKKGRARETSARGERKGSGLGKGKGKRQ